MAFNDLYDAVLNGEAQKATAATKQALEAGAAPMQLISDAMVPAMAEVGRLYNPASISCRNCCSPAGP